MASKEETKLNNTQDNSFAYTSNKLTAQRKEQTYELIMQNYGKTEIARKLGVSETTIRSYILELISEGRITQDNVKKVAYKDRFSMDKTSSDYIEKRKTIVELLKQGWENSVIRGKLNISVMDLTYFITDIINSGILTSEQIKIAREIKYQESIQHVKDKTLKGYSPSEILKSDTSGLLDMEKIFYQRKKMVADGIMSREDMKQAMERRRQIKKSKQEAKRNIDAKWQKMRKEIAFKEAHNNSIKAVIAYTKQGYNTEEIANMMRCSVSHVKRLRKEYKGKNKWFSKEELREFRKQRRIRDEAERKAKKAEEERRKKEEEKVARKKQIEIKTLIKCAMQGYTLTEIANLMNTNLSHINELIETCKAEDNWFSPEVLKNFRTQRRIKEAEAKGGKTDSKKKGRKSNESSKYSKIKSLRILAKREDRKEYNGEEYVTTTAREEFMNLLVEMSKDGIIVSEEDMNLVVDTIYTYPQLAKRDCIKFLVTNAGKLGGIEATHAMTAELMSSLRHTEYYEPIVGYMSWVKKKMKLPQMQEMKAKEMDSTAIGEKLGVSSAEVLMLLDGDEVDFLDE